MTTYDRHTERSGEAGDAELMLRRVLDLVNAAPKMPLSSTAPVIRWPPL